MANNNNTIYVNNSAELLSAVKFATGGETILLNNHGEKYGLALQTKYVGGYVEKLSTVTITSADPENPATMHNIFVRDAENLHFDNLIINSDTEHEDRGGWMSDIYVRDTDNISFTNLQMSGTAQGTRGVDTDVVVGTGAVSIASSTNVVFTDNTITNYNHGINIHENTNTLVANNEITQMQGDGMRLSGLVDTVIENNHIHNFLGSTHDINHMDMIQLWAVRETVATENLVIRNNILDAGDGKSTQTIFMRNEDVDTGRAGSDMYFKNFVIENNVIHNSHMHGISVGEIDGLVIQNNTMLHNEMISGETNVSYPGIQVNSNALNVTIANNITTKINAPSSADVENNLLVNYHQSDMENYVNNLFVNADFGGDVGISALQALPGGLVEVMGVGADLTTFNSTPGELTALYTVQKVDGQEDTFLFDASLTADENGFVDAADAEFLWDFGDGTTAIGQMVEHQFGTYERQEVTLTVTHSTTGEHDEQMGYPLTKDPVFLDVDFENNAIEDMSSYDTRIGRYDLQNLGNGKDGAGYHIEQGESLYIERGQEQFYNMDQFNITFDMQRSMVDGDDGYILYLHRSFNLKLNDDGSLNFNLGDSMNNSVSMATDAVITDGEWHEVNLSYDAIGGEMHLYVDGEVAANGITAGMTKPSQSWGIMVGSEVWSNSADFYIDNLKMTLDPYEANVTPPPTDDPVIPGDESFIPELPNMDMFEFTYTGTVQTDPRIGYTAGNDYYDLKGGDERIDMGNGDDWVYAGAGDDWIFGNKGDDVAFGGEGNDYIRAVELAFGEDGDDSLYTGYNGGKLFGGDGDDLLVGYEGVDYLVGGEGVDNMRGADGDDTLVIDRFDDWVQGGSGFDTVLYDDVGEYDIGLAGFFHSIDNFDMTNNDGNTLLVNWRDLRACDDGTLFVHGDDEDIVVLDTTEWNMQDSFTTEQVQIDGQNYTHYEADNGRWLDVSLYVAENVSVDVITEVVI